MFRAKEVNTTHPKLAGHDKYHVDDVIILNYVQVLPLEPLEAKNKAQHPVVNSVLN